MAIIGILLAFGLFLSVPPKAHTAEKLWATVNIDTILQMTSGTAQFRLTQIDNIFVDKLFKADGPNQREVLAIMLTAHSLGETVRIAFYDGDPAHIILAGVENSKSN